MTPSQQADLKAKIIGHEKLTNPQSAKLILRSFGLKFADYDDLTHFDCCLYALESSSDATLEELYKYLFPGDPLPSGVTKETSKHWKVGYLRAFLSHSTKQKLFVTQLKSTLWSFGIDCFVAHEDIEPTALWQREILAALNTCDFCVAFVCSGFKSSEYCNQEVGYMLGRSVPVFSIRIDSDPSALLAPYQAIAMGNREPNEITASLYGLIEKCPQLSFLAIKAHYLALGEKVTEFLMSPSFAVSTRILKDFETLNSFPPDLVLRIKDGWQLNDQIKNCSGVPDRIRKFVKKHTPNSVEP